MHILTAKYAISTPLMIENPVKSPIVPPIAESLSCHLAAWSLVTLSKVDVSNLIFTNLNLDLTNSKSKN